MKWIPYTITFFFSLHLLNGQIDPRNITIVRDSFGVPHIFAKTDPEVSYGLAWAYCEDDFASLQMVALPAKKAMGRAFGKNAVAADYAFDFFQCMEITEEKWKTLSPEFIELITGYVQGVNDYAATHPEEVMVKKVFPITIKEYIASSVLALTKFNGGDQALQQIFNNQVKWLIDYDKMGSNGIAVHPSRTTEGVAYLAINAHQPNEGPEAFYEAHVQSEDGWNALGGLLAGGPCILHGVNEHYGWAHTVNLCDRMDIFQLEMHPKKKYHYKYDGEWEKLKIKKVSLRIKGIPIPISKKALSSKYGPTLINEQGAFSVRLGANQEIRALDQWYQMNKGKQFSDFYKALNIQGLSMFNIIYADRYDTIFYVNNALMPVRKEDPSLNWQKTLPGNTSTTLWTQFRPLQALPQYVNPSSGFLFNTNHSPFSASSGIDNLSVSQFSPADGWETMENNRSIRFRQRFEAIPKIDFQTFRDIKFDRKYPEKLTFMYQLDSLFLLDNVTDAQESQLLNSLKTWDFQGTAESKGAAVFMLVYEYLARSLRGQEARAITKEEAVKALNYTKKYLLDHFGTLDLTLGDIQKLVRGSKEYPVGGLPDLLAPQWSRPYEGGKRKIVGGDAYVMLVKFPENELPVIETVNTYGASSHPENPHFNDQIPLFLAQKTKAMTLDKQKVMAQAERIYSPTVKKQ
ncbi:MAG: penicillin acylase family protein [Bacteroidetes bacterium]|nr:penicillin acylase family protein [Bacteroidota bacterium]